MDVLDNVRHWRIWFPIPMKGRGIDLDQWLLLEAHRYAVTGALLSFTFFSIIAIGMVWTIEIQLLLNETQTVQTVLNTYLSGIILLVSIVVSINAIVLTYEITDVSSQEDRIEGSLEFRQRLGKFAGPGVNPTNPNSFLKVMAQAIQERAAELEDIAEDEGEEEFAKDVLNHVSAIVNTAGSLDDSTTNRSSATEFGGLWHSIETDYDYMVNQSRKLRSRSRSDSTERSEELFDELMEALEVFATGREYFKTLYYNREISELSRTLLFISLPSIIVTTSTILAIDADLIPRVWGFGLPPLLVFVALTFTIALAPFIVLTAYMLRVATVALQTAAAGPFVLGGG